MTRINCGIEPIKLTDQHLLAELRELPRIFTAVIKKDNNINLKKIPTKFKLGTGHVTFFYNKCDYLFKRHNLLREEYKKRFNKIYKFDETRIENVSKLYMNDYHPTLEDQNLLIDRISTRINDSNQIPRYYGKLIEKKEAINLLY